MASQRRYWVVSPNVRNSSHTVGEWRQASVRSKAAFMGWGPNDENHRLGRTFAHTIRPGDVILIARSHRKEPEVVGFGVVFGGFKTNLKGLKPPESFGSLRQLRPFVPLSRAPGHLPFMNALNQSAAIHELRPDQNPSHERLCSWIEAKLKQGTAPDAGQTGVSAGRVKLSPLPNDAQLEYTVRSKAAVSQARKIEAALLNRYRTWIERQGRKLQIFKTNKIQCDAYEKARHNLIEAKCSEERSYVRMAVGQLLDYSFHVAKPLGKCRKAILLPKRPAGAFLLEWLSSLEISVIWEEGSDFLDNANGQFT